MSTIASSPRSGRDARFAYPRQCIVTPGVLDENCPPPRNWFDWQIAGTAWRRILRWDGTEDNWERVRSEVCPWLAHPLVVLSSYADPLLLALQGEDRQRFRFVVLENPVDRHEYLSTPDVEVVRAWQSGLCRRSRRPAREALDLPADYELLSAYGSAFLDWVIRFYPELQPTQSALSALSGADFVPLCKRDDTHWFAHRRLPIALVGVRPSAQGSQLVSGGALAACPPGLTPEALMGDREPAMAVVSPRNLRTPSRGLLVDLRPLLDGLASADPDPLRLAADHGGADMRVPASPYTVQRDVGEQVTIQLEVIRQAQLRVTLLTTRQTLVRHPPDLRLLRGEALIEALQMPRWVPDEWQPGQWVSAITLPVARLGAATALQLHYRSADG